MQLAITVQITAGISVICNMVVQEANNRTITDLLSPDSHVAAPLPFRITICITTFPLLAECDVECSSLEKCTAHCLDLQGKQPQMQQICKHVEQ